MNQTRSAWVSTSVLEDLGCISHIFTDKTGTLTQNEMLFSCFGLANDIRDGGWYNNPENHVSVAERGAVRAAAAATTGGAGASAGGASMSSFGLGGGMMSGQLGTATSGGWGPTSAPPTPVATSGAVVAAPVVSPTVPFASFGNIHADPLASPAVLVHHTGGGPPLFPHDSNLSDDSRSISKVSSKLKPDLFEIPDTPLPLNVERFFPTRRVQQLFHDCTGDDRDASLRMLFYSSLVMGVCHTVVIRGDGVQEASSPDELALVGGAALFGVEFRGRPGGNNFLHLGLEAEFVQKLLWPETRPHLRPMLEQQRGSGYGLRIICPLL